MNFETIDTPKVAAGIVLYKPNNERFEKCIASLQNQVDKIFVFDNTPEGTKDKIIDYTVYRWEGENKGIAYALNQITEAAKNSGFEWLITMDQDSIMPHGLVASYKEQIVEHPALGIVCPQVIDKRRPYLHAKVDPEAEYIESCITSASCMSICAWEKIGKFDEWLFIDLVDNEYCKRLIASGYKILRLNDWTLDQQFGKIELKSKQTQKFWLWVSKALKNENFAKFSYKKHVDPMRVYYTNRNIIYVNRKMKHYGKVGYKNYNCKGYLGFLICFVLPSILRAQDKSAVMKAVRKGFLDGIKQGVQPWHAAPRGNDQHAGNLS